MVPGEEQAESRLSVPPRPPAVVMEEESKEPAGWPIPFFSLPTNEPDREPAALDRMSLLLLLLKPELEERRIPPPLLAASEKG